MDLFSQFDECEHLVLWFLYLKHDDKYNGMFFTLSKQVIILTNENILICSESIGWVPMWGEYADEVIEDYIEAYGLLVEDLQVLYGAYREDNLNCELSPLTTYAIHCCFWC